MAIEVGAVILTLLLIPATVTLTIAPRHCVDGEERGANTCSFICGLNGQRYPENRPGGSFGNERCEFPGQAISHQCAQVCVDGRWQSFLCNPCCTEYPDNHCNIKCALGGYDIKEGCDPLNPPTVATTTLTVATTTTTRSSVCMDGVVKGENTCSYICGLNDQWLPSGMLRGDPSQRCQNKGEFVPHTCNSQICLNGTRLPAPCTPCCQEYPDNICSITCTAAGRYIMEENCDPFIPSTPLAFDARCRDGAIRDTSTCGYMCGINNQWYPKTASGVTILKNRCSRRGLFVQGTCPEICASGNWVRLPCYRCCQAYPESSFFTKIMSVLCDKLLP